MEKKVKVEFIEESAGLPVGHKVSIPEHMIQELVSKGIIKVIDKDYKPKTEAVAETKEVVVEPTAEAKLKTE